MKIQILLCALLACYSLAGSNQQNDYRLLRTFPYPTWWLASLLEKSKEAVTQQDFELFTKWFTDRPMNQQEEFKQRALPYLANNFSKEELDANSKTFEWLVENGTDPSTLYSKNGISNLLKKSHQVFKVIFVDKKINIPSSLLNDHNFKFWESFSYNIFDNQELEIISDTSLQVLSHLLDIGLDIRKSYPWRKNGFYEYVLELRLEFFQNNEYEKILRNKILHTNALKVKNRMDEYISRTGQGNLGKALHEKSFQDTIIKFN